MIQRKLTAMTKDTAGMTIDGDLLSYFPRCCGPVPPEPIAGYITLRRGVSIHRQDCASLKRLREANPERVIAVEWGQGTDRAFPVEVNVRAYDRRGLVRDIGAVLADFKIDIHAMNAIAHEREGIADMIT